MLPASLRGPGPWKVVLTLKGDPCPWRGGPQCGLISSHASPAGSLIPIISQVEDLVP